MKMARSNLRAAAFSENEKIAGEMIISENQIIANWNG